MIYLVGYVGGHCWIDVGGCCLGVDFFLALDLWLCICYEFGVWLVSRFVWLVVRCLWGCLSLGGCFLFVILAWLWVCGGLGFSWCWQCLLVRFLCFLGGFKFVCCLRLR